MLPPDQIAAGLQAFGYHARLWHRRTDSGHYLVRLAGRLPRDERGVRYHVEIEPSTLRLYRWEIGPVWSEEIVSQPLLPVIWWLEEAGFPRLQGRKGPGILL